MKFLVNWNTCIVNVRGVVLNSEKCDVFSSLRLPGILVWSIDRVESTCIHTLQMMIFLINYIFREILSIRNIFCNTLNNVISDRMNIKKTEKKTADNKKCLISTTSMYATHSNLRETRLLRVKEPILDLIFFRNDLIRHL